MKLSLTPDERRILLEDAHESIASKIENRQPEYSTEAADKPALQTACSAFVSLHKQGNLRGCIGRMASNLPLIETVRTMAREAAFGDPRFPPMQKSELELCDIEISALSPMEICPDPQKVEVGVHGLYLIRGGRSGVLLPQVPVEQGWNLKEYLDYICLKAGLPQDSYNAPDATLYTFTAEIINGKS